MIGRTLDGRYAIVRLLGQGGMGAVYEARHAGTGRRVAVKIILGAGSREEEQVARFQREARAVGAVESDHIAQVFDTGRDPETGAPYIAMEFLEGEDVQALLDRLGPLPVDLALRITLQACLGLARAHGAGVIHRDIKPANLFLARKEQGQRVVKLLDFGVAKVTGTSPETSGDHGLTKTGAMMGSPLYMSPEQARGAGAVDARSDLWSLGITLFQCISGRRPNDHVQGLGELLIAIVTMPAPWLQTVAPWAPGDVAHVVRRALTIDLAGRFATADEMAQALQALLPYGHAIVDPMLVPLGATTRSYVAPQMAPPPLAITGAAPPTTLGTTGTDPRVPPPATPARPLALIAGAVVVAALAGGGGVYWQLRPRAAAPPAETPSPPTPTQPVAAAQPPAPAPLPSASASASASAAQAEPPPAAPVSSAAPPPATPLPGKRAGKPVLPRSPSTPTAPPPKVSDDESSRK